MINNSAKRSKSGEVFAWLVIGPILLIVMGSLIGVWIKFFWLGWVLAPCVQ